MSFTLSWTGPKGGESKAVDTAEKALAEYDRLNGHGVRLTVKDDRGVKLSEDDLFRIIGSSEDRDHA